MQTSDTSISFKNVSVFFYLDYYQKLTLRDFFIGKFKDPFSFKNNREIFYPLRDISINIKAGSKLGLLGKNGSGKTTLCRVICGMITPSAGSFNISKETRAIFDINVGVMPELTGKENASLLARFIYPEIIDNSHIVSDSLNFAELNGFEDVPFKNYSKGMKARLMLSLISYSPAPILILDEIFDGTDTYFQKKIAERMMNFIHQSETVIFVSHSTETIRKVCREVVVLDKGELKFYGDVEEGIALYEKYYS